MTNIPANCPSCQSEMVVTQVGCTHCDTTIVGHYPVSSFFKLPPESLSFLETFVKNRGNVKEMEREMDMSYWTIRSKLDKIVQEMTSEPTDEKQAKAKRLAILSDLREGKTDANTATQLLEEIGK